MNQYYPGDSHSRDIARKQFFDLAQKAKAVKQAAQKNKIVKVDCFDQIDRPLRDLSCDAGGYAGPIYKKVHPKYKQTQADIDLVWAMCCSAVITGQPATEAN
jgi:hypothetical protein